MKRIEPVLRISRPSRSALRSAAALALTLLAAAVPVAAGGGAAPAPPVSALATIPLDEIHAGLTGYGMSVFSGATPERFSVEVLGVLRNLSPGTSYILARLSGHGLEETGVIAGMSGSPVFLDGRLAGAVAFSWPYSKEAIAGITPIDQMRRLGDGPRPPIVPVAAGGKPPVPLAALVAGRFPEDLLERQLSRLAPRLANGAIGGLEWSASGFGGQAQSLLAHAVGSLAPSGQATMPPSGQPAMSPQGLEPGGAVAAILVDGALRLAATGTVTDRTGDDLLAFGHPFLGLGRTSLPMASAEVITVVSNQYSSFKLANLGPVVGAFEQDRQAGIRGRLGAEAPTVPLVVRVSGMGNEEYRMRVADVPELVPVLVATGVLGGLDSASYTAGAQGLDLEARFQLAGHGELTVRQSFDGPSAAIESAKQILAFAGYLLQNDLEQVKIESIDVELRQVAQPRTATLVGAHAEHTVVRPGEEVPLNLDFVAYRGDPFRRSLTVHLPADLPAGRYSLLVGDGTSVDGARLAIEPSDPVSFGQALELLRSLHSRRDLAVLGVYGGRGLAVAGEVMPRLPGSVRSLWSAAASGSAVPLRLAVAQQQVEPMEVPIEGLVRIDLDVRRREPVTGGPEVPPGDAGPPDATLPADAGSTSVDLPAGAGDGSGEGR